MEKLYYNKYYNIVYAFVGAAIWLLNEATIYGTK